MDNRKKGIAKEEIILDSDHEERGHWGSKAEFILSCIGLSVGIGNVWRFPYLAYENGGAAFLIPYAILLLLIGKPLFFLETALGQYCQLGAVSVWKMAPVMQGIGIAMVIQSMIIVIYYTQLMTYTLHYMFGSFASEVPWAHCDPSWADENCFEVGGAFPCIKYNLTGPTDTINCTNKNESSAMQYWEKRVLRSDRLGLQTFGDIGTIHWDLALCLLLSWIIVFFCMIKGVKSSGKVVYFTATFPYVVLLIIMIAGVRLDGAVKGLNFLFVPRWRELLSIAVWKKAAEQMFYSLSIGWGSLIVYGSYNKFNNKVHLDAFFISFVDFLTSIIACVAIFSVLGAMAEDLGVEVSQVAAGGTGLAFIAYPEAISRTLPVPPLFSVLFFFMLFTLGLDSIFAMLETEITAIFDWFPKSRKYKQLIIGLNCVACFILALPFCFDKGIYIFYLMDYFTGGFCIISVAIFEIVTISWIYGVNRICADFEFMLGFKLSIIWKVTWAFICPVVLTFLLVYAIVTFQEPKYNNVSYPVWAIGIGWSLVAFVLLFIPLVFTAVFVKHLRAGTLGDLFKPTDDWGPGLPEAKEKLIQTNRNQIPLSFYDNKGFELIKLPRPTLNYANMERHQQ